MGLFKSYYLRSLNKTPIQYELKHLNANGILNTTTSNISFLAFMKHLTFAGVGKIRRHPLLSLRYLGLFFEFQQYWLHSSKAFQLSSILKNDPTETAYISNRIGRAFADYFAKRIYRARFTHSYEDAMILKGHCLKGARPDFYCDNLQQQFAIEAKGYRRASVSDEDMKKHKAQSGTGPIPVNFSVASVAFNLYKHPKIKFYDPVNDAFEYDYELNLQLRSQYFNSVLEILELFDIETERGTFGDYYSYDVLPFLFPEYRLLIHRAIVEREWRDNSWLNNIEIQSENNNEYYIDLDGIGLITA